MGMAPGGFMSSREFKPDLNISLPESPFKRRLTLGGSLKKREKSKPKFIPGVTSAIDNSDEDEE